MKIKNIKNFALLSAIFLFLQNVHSAEESESQAAFSAREFSEETSDTLEPHTFLRQNLKRDVERRRSLDPTTEQNVYIMTQDACPYKVEPHSLSKLKERSDDNFSTEDSISHQERINFESLKEAAEQGDGCSQYQLGFRYSFGEGIKQNDEKATKWFRKATEQGVEGAEKVLNVSERIMVENQLVTKKERLYNLNKKTKE